MSSSPIPTPSMTGYMQAPDAEHGCARQRTRMWFLAFALFATVLCMVAGVAFQRKSRGAPFLELDRTSRSCDALGILVNLAIERAKFGVRGDVHVVSVLDGTGCLLSLAFLTGAAVFSLLGAIDEAAVLAPQVGSVYPDAMLYYCGLSIGAHLACLGLFCAQRGRLTCRCHEHVGGSDHLNILSCVLHSALGLLASFGALWALLPSWLGAGTAAFAAHVAVANSSVLCVCALFCAASCCWLLTGTGSAVARGDCSALDDQATCGAALLRRLPLTAPTTCMEASPEAAWLGYGATNVCQF